MSEYIAFKLETPSSSTRRTEIWRVVATRDGSTLGRIAWMGRWRQYALYPERDTIWNPDCLGAVNEKIRALMAARRPA